IAGAVLGHSRIIVERRRPPIEAAVMLVPMELRYPEGKRRRAVEDAEVAAAVEAEPDLVAPIVARTIPDQVDRVRLLRREAVACRRAGGAADIAPRVEAAGPGLVDDAIDDSICAVASGHGGSTSLSQLGGRDRAPGQLLHRD